MKKRILKLTAFAAALALLAGVLWFSNGLLGNPVSKFLAARAAREYGRRGRGNVAFSFRAWKSCKNFTTFSL